MLRVPPRREGRSIMEAGLLGLGRGDTFGSVLARNRGVGPGFDFLRMALAGLIFIGHAKWVAGGVSLGATVHLFGMGPAPGALVSTYEWVGFTRPFKVALVPGFFALSGFLVAGSALRLRRTSTFLAHRALRIFPALVVEVLLSAFLLGPALTTLPLSGYFADPRVWSYLMNMVGHVHFLLPGVFEQNTITHAVNVNLWTLPAELYCYILCAVLMISRLMYDRRAVTTVALVATVVLAMLNLIYGISAGTPYPHHVILYYFLLGLAAYHWRDLIPCRPLLFAPIAAAAYVLLMFPSLTYVVAPLVTWCTMFVGMIAFPRFRLLASGDYSYGFYLYGFPLVQALIAAVPWFYGRQVAFVAATIILTALFAALSWHMIEKHVIKLKRRLPEAWFPTTPRERKATAEAA